MLVIENICAWSSTHGIYNIEEGKVFDENMLIEVDYYIAENEDEDCLQKSFNANDLRKWLFDNGKMKVREEVVSPEFVDINELEFEFKHPSALFESLSTTQRNELLIEFLTTK